MELQHLPLVHGWLRAGVVLEHRWLRSTVVKGALLCASLVFALHAAQNVVVQHLEKEGIEVKANGPETPAQFGAPSRDEQLIVGDHTIQTRLVLADSTASSAVLIFHGNGEAISDWADVQARLWRLHITSMVFDYSGFGASTGTPSVSALRADALSAYRAFVRAIPVGQHVCVIGHSLGNAVMLDALHDLQPAPVGVVVHAGFSSAKDYAVLSGMAPGWIAPLMPDLWDNEARLAQTTLPVMVMHSDKDEVIPFAMGKRLAQSASASTVFHSIHNTSHDQLYTRFPQSEWNPILSFCAQHTRISTGR